MKRKSILEKANVRLTGTELKGCLQDLVHASEF